MGCFVTLNGMSLCYTNACGATIRCVGADVRELCREAGFSGVSVVFLFPNNREHSSGLCDSCHSVHCVFTRVMASDGRGSNHDVHQTEATARPPTLQCDPTIKPEARFGRGIADSAYLTQTRNRMKEFFQQETLSDVMLMAEGQSIPCHRLPLAAASEYFYNKVAVDNNALNYNLVEIEGVSFNALEVIVSYVYTGNIDITVENATDVIPACKMLKLTSAYDICERFMLDKVTAGNCIGLYKMAKTNEVQQLLAKTLDVMVDNFTDVVSGREFLTMSEPDVVEYIQNENLKIPNEDPVFEAIVLWVEHERQRESTFSRLITHVRLRYCTPHFLTHVVSKEPLMGSLDCQKALVAAALLQNRVTATSTDSSSEQPSTAPRKYVRGPIFVTIGGITDPGALSHLQTVGVWMQLGGD